MEAVPVSDFVEVMESIDLAKRGEEVRVRRVALGLSREQLAEHAGVTPGSLWSIENGKRTRGGTGPLLSVERSLRQLLAPVEKPASNGGTSTPGRGRKRSEGRSRPAWWTVTTEWNGMRPGSRFVVTDLVGETFVFVEHVHNTKSNCEWVTGYGGVPGPRGTATMRSFAVERVRGL